MLCSDRALFPTAVDLADGQPVYGHLIANRWVQGDRPPLSVIAPATGERFAWLGSGGGREIDDAVVRPHSPSSAPLAAATAASISRPPPLPSQAKR